MSGINNEQINRRTFIKAASSMFAGLVFASGKLYASARQTVSAKPVDDLEMYDFVMPRVKLEPLRQPGMGLGPDTWNVRPGGDANLLLRLSSVIRCTTKPIPGASNWEPSLSPEGRHFNAVVTFDDIDRIKKFPFLFMTDENAFRLNQQQKDNLKEYIMRGGFIFMDDCVVGNGGDFFYQSACTLIAETFGNTAFKKIPNDHEVFHNVYDLSNIGLPYIKGQNHGARGLFLGERLAIFLSSNDIHCGWCDSLGMEWPIQKYEQAIQMGVNIIVYAISH
jgi:hypothetical protein